MCREVGYGKWRRFVDRYPGCGTCHSHVILAQKFSTPLKGLLLQTIIFQPPASGACILILSDQPHGQYRCSIYSDAVSPLKASLSQIYPSTIFQTHLAIYSPSLSSNLTLSSTPTPSSHPHIPTYQPYPKPSTHPKCPGPHHNPADHLSSSSSTMQYHVSNDLFAHRPRRVVGVSSRVLDRLYVLIRVLMRRRGL